MSAADPYAGLGVDGPAIAPVPRAPSVLTQANAKAAWDKGSAFLETQIANLPDAAKKIARDKFFSDPRIAALRTAAAVPVNTQQNAVAGPPAIVPVTTKRAEIQRVARESVQQRQQDSGMDTPTGNFLTALKSGIIQGANTISMGLPNALAAGAERVLPSAITGNDTDASYMDILRTIQAKNEAEGERNSAGNFIGNLMGSVPAAIAATPAALEALAPTAIGRTAQAVTAASPRLAKVAAAVGGGALSGAEGSLANGQDPVTGAEIGAVAGPVLGLGAKGVGWVGKKAANVLGLPGASKILKSITTASRDEIQSRIDALRAQGIEPTMFEVLPLADRNRISKNLVGRSDATLEGTQRLVSDRLGNIGPEMANRVNDVAAPQRAAATQEITDAMTAARGTPGAPVPEMPGDAAVAARATRAPIDMQAQRGREARAIMAPHDNAELFNTIDEILPQHPELQPNGDVNMVSEDPAVTAMIRAKAKLLTRKNANEASGGITGRNMSDLLSELADESGNPNNPARDVARAAVQHIEEQLQLNHPEFLEAHGRMTDAFAGRSRMAEGMNEGMNTRTRATVQNVTQPVRNAYESVEGTTGRALGQANALETGFAQAGPRKAISQAAALPNDQAAIAQNLGPDAAQQIAQTAQAQTEGAQALAGLDRQSKTNPTALGPDDLAAAVLGLNPASMIRTKIAAIQKLTQAIGIPEQKARGLVELIFSTNPARRAQALQMLNTTPTGQAFLSDLGRMMGVGSSAAVTSNTAPAEPDTAPQPQEQPAPAVEDPYADLGVEGAAVPADVPTEAPAPEASAEPPASAEATADPNDDIMRQLADGADPQMQELLRQIQSNGAAPGQENIPHGRAVIQSLFPAAHITEDKRAPNSKLGRENPNSYHVKTENAVDVRPIPGMTFEQFIAKIEAAGHTIIEKRDEVKHPVKWATGPHWHVVLA